LDFPSERPLVCSLHWDRLREPVLALVLALALARPLELARPLALAALLAAWSEVQDPP
jgi:hypothetical protein